jgi:hypothetical protein
VSGLILTSSSDHWDHCRENINNIVGVYTIYRDEYNNELDENNIMTDVF